MPSSIEVKMVCYGWMEKEIIIIFLAAFKPKNKYTFMTANKHKETNRILILINDVVLWHGVIRDLQ